MVSKLALGAIWGYQRYISPRKGYRCAHSVLHGGTGCSGFAKYAIRDHGLWGAIPHVRQRFRDCRDASLTLRANCAVHSDAPDDDPHPRRRANRRKKEKGDGCLGYGCDGLDCATSSCALPGFCAAGRAGSQTPDGGGGGDGCMPGDCSGPDCGSCGGCDCAPSCN